MRKISILSREEDYRAFLTLLCREHGFAVADGSDRRSPGIVLVDLDATPAFSLPARPTVIGYTRRHELTAADGVMIPLQCEYFALEGLTMMVDTIRSVRKRLNPKLEINGFLFTMFDGRTNLAAQVVREVKKYFADKIYKTVIVRNVRLSEAPSHGMPAILYDADSTGAKNHLALAKEIINKNEK